MPPARGAGGRRRGVVACCDVVVCCGGVLPVRRPGGVAPPSWSSGTPSKPCCVCVWAWLLPPRAELRASPTSARPAGCSCGQLSTVATVAPGALRGPGHEASRGRPWSLSEVMIADRCGRSSSTDGRPSVRTAPHAGRPFDIEVSRRVERAVTDGSATARFELDCTGVCTAWGRPAKVGRARRPHTRLWFRRPVVNR